MSKRVTVAITVPDDEDRADIERMIADNTYAGAEPEVVYPDTMTSILGMHVVIHGNPVTGLTFYGPFNNGPESVEWAADNLTGEDWWVAPLRAQEES